MSTDERITTMMMEKLAQAMATIPLFLESVQGTLELESLKHVRLQMVLIERAAKASSTLLFDEIIKRYTPEEAATIRAGL